MKTIVRSETAQAVLSIIAHHLDKQEEKGVAEYGHSLDGVTHDKNGNVYDWKTEALSECIDALQYSVKRIQELEAAERPIHVAALNGIRRDFAHAEADMDSKIEVLSPYEMGVAMGQQQGIAMVLRALDIQIDGINR